MRILLADDHTLVRAGLRLLIERQPDLTVVAEASDGRQAIELAAAHSPEVAVIDVAMPGLNGIEAAAEILRARPATAIAMLSMHSDEGYVLRCLRAGTRGYVLKDSAESDLIAAIHALAAGKSFFSAKVSQLLKEDHVLKLRIQGGSDSLELLTAREREILQLIGEGNSNKDVANRLNLSLYTVETHRGNILQKLHLHGTADLILYAVRRGLVA